LIETEDVDMSFAKHSRIVCFPFGLLVSKKSQRRRAFSLAELMLIVVILGVFAMIAVPRVDYGIVKRYKAEATAKKIVTGLRLARSLAISDAATNTKGYDLNMLGGTPYTGYEIENADTKAIVTTCTIDSDVSVTGDVACKIEPLGNTQTGNGQLTVSAEGKNFTLTVLGVTGITRCVEN
jgi:Tfp pilus assembly protein PilE